MIGRCVSEGIRTARRNLGLTWLLWFWTLVLGAIAAFPAWFWLGRAFDFAPESDRLLTGFNFAVFAELAQYDRSPVQGLILVVVLGALALALLGNPLVSGGILETIMRRRDESFMEGFWRGAGRHFWRFLRLLIYALVTGIIVFAGIGASLAPLTGRAMDSSWEPAPVALAAVQAIVFLVAGAWLVLALDFARVRTAAENSRKTLRVWCSSLVFVWRHPLVTFGLLAVAALLFAAIAGIFTGICATLTARSWVWIGFAIVLQQIMMYSRAGLRVVLVAGQVGCYRRITPAAGSAPARMPPPELPVPEGTEVAAPGPPPASQEIPEAEPAQGVAGDDDDPGGPRA